MNITPKTQVSPSATADEIFNSILSRRGYPTAKSQLSFLHPVEPTLPYLLKESGIKKNALSTFKKVLDSHLGVGHDVLVFGDYDADGITATAIMWQTLVAYAKLSHSNSRLLPFIPDRHNHGYGLSTAAISDIQSGVAFAQTQFPNFAPQLIITVDTGIVANVPVSNLRKAGIDVIITDHHLPIDADQLDPSPLPPSALLHTTSTSGAGVAWICSQYLLGSSANHLLDLATIGVVADMMPMSGINRSLVSHGLNSLSHSTRPGIVALFRAMGLTNKDLTTYDISFGIAPRINAAGRIHNPTDALRLLCTSDQKLANDLAIKIESHNQDRQSFTEQALQDVASQKVDHHVIVVIGNYHEGVIGLVAGKLVEKFHRPAVVMSAGLDIVKGSARSIAGVNITDLLRALPINFLGLGGHSQAAGFSLAASDVTKFTHVLVEHADQSIASDLLVKSESVDLELALSQTTLKLAELLGDLEPFGIANPKPRFLLQDLTVLEDRALGNGDKHHKLTVVDGNTTRTVLMFNTQHQHPISMIRQLICSLDINVWRDKRSLQLIASYVET